MNYKEIFLKAYQLMDEPIIDGNCGLLCNFHCCRDLDDDGSRLGVYLWPHEYEAIYKDEAFEIEKVPKEEHGDLYMPKHLSDMYYFYCNGSMNCPRDLRPLHCRTYPIEAHIESDQLMLVVEKDQIHSCPLLNQQERWREEYINGIYEAWSLLIQIPDIKTLVKYYSDNRIRRRNIQAVIKGF